MKRRAVLAGVVVASAGCLNDPGGATSTETRSDEVGTDRATT